jgi:membrane-associated phospholipid phosphatase
MSLLMWHRRLGAPDRATVVLTLCAVAVVALAGLGMAATNVSIDAASAKPLGLLLLVQLGVALYCRFRRIDRLQPVAEIVLCFVIACFGLLPISYLAVRFNTPLVDDWLMAMDKAMGFDWVALVKTVDEWPPLASFLRIAYSSFGFQLFFLPVFLALFRNDTRAHAMILAYMLIVVGASIIGIWFPARGAFFAYGLDQTMLNNVDAHFGYAFLDEFHAARTDTYFSMSLDRVEGLLTFPSVHVAVAVLCIWASWGSRLLAGPFLILNAGMTLSALTNGGHYLADVIAGAALAAAAIGAGAYIFPATSWRRSRLAERLLWAEVKAHMCGRARSAGEGALSIPE